MAQKPSIPKGTRDFGPVEMAKRNYIFNTIKDVYLYLLLGFAVVIFVIMCFYKLNSKNYDRIVSELERGHYHPNAKYTPFSEA